jgi:hypothetical protein
MIHIDYIAVLYDTLATARNTSAAGSKFSEAVDQSPTYRWDAAYQVIGFSFHSVSMADCLVQAWVTNLLGGRIRFSHHALTSSQRSIFR